MCGICQTMQGAVEWSRRTSHNNLRPMALGATHCFGRGLMRESFSWYFEQSQPQRMTSWQKTMFHLSPIYSSRKSSNHKLSKKQKISSDTPTLNKKYTNIKYKIFEELVLLVLPLLKKKKKKAHRGRCYRGHFQCGFNYGLMNYASP